MPVIFTKEELEILLTYQFNSEIDIKEYLTRFMYNNPLNFPITSSFMAYVYPRDSANVKTYFSNSSVVDNGLRSDTVCKNILKNCIVMNKISFITVLVALHYHKFVTQFKILSMGTDLVIYFYISNTIVLVNQYFNKLLIVKNNYISEVFSHINSNSYDDMISEIKNEVKELIYINLTDFNRYTIDDAKSFIMFCITASGVEWYKQKISNITSTDEKFKKVFPDINTDYTLPGLYYNGFDSVEPLITYNETITHPEFNGSVKDFEGDSMILF